MKVLFCGLGSIGQRHIQNLKTVAGKRGIDCRIDAVRATQRELPTSVSALINKSCISIVEADDDYDMAFITNPTAMHRQTVKALAGKTKSIFIEKPVFDSTCINIESLGLRADGVYHVACPLRQHPVIRRMKELADENKIFAVRAICSSYLPGWRSGADYRNCYSAKRAEGGGVVLDLIHEWDYLCYLFGIPDKVQMFAGKFSDLEIDSDDVAVYIARYRNMLLSLHLDYVGRVPARNIVMYCADDVITGDLLAGTVLHEKAGKLETLPKSDVHLAEIEYFVDCVLAGNTNTINTVPHALEVLKTAFAESGM